MTSVAPAEALALGEWTATPEFVAEYLAALESPAAIYEEQRLVPPMALAARALGLIIEKLGLASGTVHTSQEVVALKPVAFGQKIAAYAKPSRPFRRGQWEFLSVEFTMREMENGEAAEPVLRGKTTVMSPVEA